MSLAASSYESTELIDVSQNARSSPTAEGTARLETAEKIEDSMEAWKRAKRGGPGQQDHAVAHDDGEGGELYDVTPNAKQSSKTAMASREAVAKHADTEVLGGPVRAPTSGKPGEEIAQAQTGARNALDELLEKGATARPPQVNRHKAKLERRQETTHGTMFLLTSPKRADNRFQAKDQRPHPASPKTGTPAVDHAAMVGPTAKRNIKPAPTPGPSNVPLTSKTSKPTAYSTTSAVAALRAKKQGNAPSSSAKADPDHGKTSLTNRESAKPTTSTKSPLRERHVNRQTPAPSMPAAGGTVDHATTGKLKSRRLGMLAKTPGKSLDIAGADGQVPGTARTEDAGAHRDSATTSKKSVGKPEITRGALKRPSVASKGVIRRDTHDLPDEPPPLEETSGPATKRTIRPKTAARSGKAVQVKSEKDTVQSRSPTQIRARPKKTIASEESDHEVPKIVSARKQPSRAAKAGLKVTDKSSASVADDGSDVPVPDVVDGAGEEGMRDLKSRQNAETIEEFEQTVLDFEGSEPLTKRSKAKHAKATSLSHEQPSKRKSNVAQNVDNASEARNGKAPAESKAGASQEHAIVLSDRHQSSSLEPSPVRAVSTAPTTVAKAVTVKKEGTKPPQTPAFLHSSPPVCAVDPDASRRSTIIGFDRSGPRKQGKSSANKVSDATHRPDRSSMPPQSKLLSDAGERFTREAEVEKKRRQGPSSVAASIRTTRTEHTARPSNVAETVDDALAGFMGKKCAGNAFEGDAHDGNDAVQDDDAGYTFVDDAAADVIAAPLPDLQSARLLTASQTAMPPPAPKVKKVDKMQPTPGIPAQPEIVPKPRAPLVDKHDAHHVGSKRLLEFEREMPEKKAKTSVASISQPTEQPSKAAEAKQRSVRSMSTSVTVPSLFAAYAAPRAPRITKKPSRHASQGVDFHGSPIPPNLEVPNHATALEIFSQQAALSSDDVPVKATKPDRQPTYDASTNMINSIDQFMTMPSYQQPVLSSNEKKRPTAPEEDSEAITAIALTRVDPTNLILRETALPRTDPFTSSEDARKEPVKGSTSSALHVRLRKHSNNLGKKRRSEAVELEDDPDKTLVEPEPAPKRTRYTKHSVSMPSDVASEGSSSSQDSELPAIGDWRRGLQPHQLNLFDELIGISHKLVRHLVDHETAAREMIQDYRREGLSLIKQAELKQTREHHMVLQRLDKRRKELQKGFAKQKMRLQGNVAEAEHNRAERIGKMKKGDEQEGFLRGLLERYV